jgi:hypothetical protein
MLTSSSSSVLRVSILVLAIGVLWCCAGTGCAPTDNLGNDLVDGADQDGTDNPADRPNDGSDDDNPTQVVPGDLTGDGAVNAADMDGFLAAYQAAFGADKSKGDANFNAQVDMDSNGIIDFRDLQLFDVIVPDAIE